MTAPPRAQPLFLDVAPDPVFAMFHPAAADTPSRTSVLITAPWGWDEVTSYRSRRAWAERLAEAGHPTLRIDFPGAGDSAGLPGDASRVAAWTASVSGAAAWLAAATSAGRVAAIGLGLGGLVAAAAVSDGAMIDDLVLWATPAHGRAFLREQQAFANLQSSRYGPTGESGSTGLPDGWLEVSGFVLSAETIAALDGLDLVAMNTGRLRRALLMDRDGLPIGASLRRHFEAAGVEVSEASGHGWGAMCFHPEQYDPPLDVIERVTSWIGAADALRAVPEANAPEAFEIPGVADGVELIVDGRRIREHALEPEERLGRSFGILSEPADQPRSDLCAVFLNAGAVRRIGPNRMWVETSRRLAATGVPSVRIDVEGIGDADGDAGMYVDVGRFYTPDRGEQIVAILDSLQAQGYGPRFVLVGLCAGGYWAFNTGAEDARVIAALVLNPRALVWDTELVARRDARQVQRLGDPGLWRRILRGDVEAARIAAVARAFARQTLAGLARRVGGGRSGPPDDSLTAQLERTLDRLRDTKTRVVLAFSGDEPVYDELARDGILGHMARWPGIVVEALPGSDHTVRPIVAQDMTQALLDREFASLLGASPDAATAPDPTPADRRSARPRSEPSKGIVKHG
jgi:pimeloyl-ACP methyl ester carboxylesterase